MKKWTIGFLLFVVIPVVGCNEDSDLWGNSKMTRVQVTFHNTTDDPLELQVNGPGEGTGYLGPIPPGGRIITFINVNNQFLPGSYSYFAGEYPGNFVIVRDINPLIIETIPEGTQAVKPGYRHPEGDNRVGQIPVVIHP